LRGVVLDGHAPALDRLGVALGLQLFEVGQVAYRGHHVDIAGRVRVMVTVLPVTFIEPWVMITSPL
jgi:hypothetical protein